MTTLRQPVMRYQIMRWLFALTLFLVVATCRPADAQELNCLQQPATLYGHLQQQIQQASERRLETYEALKTAEDIENYQSRLREFFVDQLGGFPQRSPLNAQTVGTIDADGYRIEKVIFDSRPNHRITANLYLPDGEGPFPGVVVASGHSRTAKTADYNQRFGISLAKHSMAALCFDPIGQGERSQILDEQGTNQISGTTTEHLLVGVGSILVGRNTAAYEVWDAMRCVDYLISRPEIDGDKIGMTGCSGGGTQTSYTMALDPRIVCAAPACYLTTFARLIETIGPQDAEQNIFAQLKYGLDQPDYVLLRAPQPTLISSTTGDFFDIGGTWENFRQAKRIYGRLGLPERVDLVEIEGRHGVTPQNLATITHWMKRWLLGRDEPVEAVVWPPRPAEELLCTDSGQVLTTPGEQSVFDLNAARASELAKERSELQQPLTDPQLRGRIREKIGLENSSGDVTIESQRVGEVQREGYVVEKYLLKKPGGFPLPTLVFRPQQPSGRAYVYLHDAGKAGDAAVGGRIEHLVRRGDLVVAVDLSGQGETATGSGDELLTDWKTFYTAYLLGRSIVGIRVEDVQATARFAASLPGVDETKIGLVGAGRSGIVALHAAALSPETFATVTVQDSLRDWSSLVGNNMPSGQLDHVVHGALELYDLPDLVRLAGPFVVTAWTEPGLFTPGIEGPACDRDGNLYAVSFGDKRTIGRVTPDGKAEAWVTLPEGSAGNGIRFDREGQMYVADYTGHNVLRIDPASKQVTVFAHQPTMHQPNDLAIAADGTLYASDPDWTQGDGALWKITRGGEVVQLGDDMGTTNGIEVSPDGKTLYVAESRQHRVLAFDLDENGIDNRRVLIQFDDHSLDGMRCDVEGNLYLTRHGAALVVKVSPAGDVLQQILLPGNKPSNLCFGGPDGKTVYVTEVDTQQVLRFRVDTPGLAWQRWQANGEP